MYTILMDVLCVDGNAAILPGEGANIELVIECVVALILLDLFGKVIVEGVKATCFPAAPGQPPLCSLQVQATGIAEFVDVADDTLEARLESDTGCALAELFRAVVINTVRVSRCERVVESASAA